MALTVKAVEALKGGPHRREIADGTVGGLFLVVQTSGSKSWVIRFRLGGRGSRTRKHTLGPWPALGLAAAREAAGEALRLIKRGIDPIEDRKAVVRAEAQRHAHAFEAVAAEFIQRYLIGPNPAKPNLRSASAVAAAINRDLVPPWRGRPITEIRRADAVKLLEDIADRSPSVAHHTLSFGRKLFNWARARDVYGLEHSPFDGVRPNEVVGPKTKRKRVLTDHEIRMLWRATAELDYPLAPMTRLLLVSGQRLRQVAEATHSEFDLERGLWTIPAERAKNAIALEVPLPLLALDILASLPRAKRTSAFLFSTTDGDRPVSGFHKLKARLDIAMLKAHRRELGVPEDDEELRKLLGLAVAEPVPEDYHIKPWVFHDLRRTMRTRLSALAIPDQIRELMIGHVQSDLHQIYDLHSYREEKATGFRLWADCLLRAVEPVPANIIAIRAAVS